MTERSGSPDYDEWRVGELGDMWIPVPVTVERPADGDGPTAQLTFDVSEGRLQCREVRFIANPDGREVRRADLRAVSIDDIREEVAAAWARPPKGKAGSRFLVWSPGDEPTRRAAVHEERRARRRLNEDTLRRVLEVYRSDSTGAPTRAVAGAFDVAHRTASLYVKKAKDAEQEGRL